MEADAGLILMDSIKTEVVVIGAGPGGYAPLLRGGQNQRVCWSNRNAGRRLLNRGCIPSKHSHHEI
jgi:pyruvate/2-oxoglutarate dehydrogenase complex dihydrolipoamide dehydrogenase (E3) component